MGLRQCLAFSRSSFGRRAVAGHFVRTSAHASNEQTKGTADRRFGLSHASRARYGLISIEINFQSALRSLKHEPAISAFVEVGAHGRGHRWRETPL